MDKFSLLLIFFFFSFGLFAQDKDTKISEITVDELTEVVRTIVQETLENCSRFDPCSRRNMFGAQSLNFDPIQLSLK